MRPLAGRYELGSFLGAGGVCVVQKGYDRILDRDVAVRLLAARWSRNRDIRERMRVGAQCGGLVNHPHVEAVYDCGVGRTRGRGRVQFVVTELLDGPTLAGRLSIGRLTSSAAIHVGARLASALAAVHVAGVVHRDVTPANVMLTTAGPKLVDFGFATFADPARTAREKWIVGTRDYLAPERWSGRPATEATDVYGLGRILYECLTGASPWPGRTGTDLRAATIHLPPRSLPADQLPPPVSLLIERCVSPSPEDRPSSAVMSAALARVAAEASGGGGGQPGRTPTNRRTSKYDGPPAVP
jgi:serine/threonine-protein kinase